MFSYIWFSENVFLIWKTSFHMQHDCQTFYTLFILLHLFKNPLQWNLRNNMKTKQKKFNVNWCVILFAQLPTLIFKILRKKKLLIYIANLNIDDIVCAFQTLMSSTTHKHFQWFDLQSITFDMVDMTCILNFVLHKLFCNLST